MPLTLVTLGACLLHGPIGSAIRRKRAVTTTSLTMGMVTPDLYTADEANQAIKFFKGELSVPNELKPYCGLDANFDPAVKGGARLLDGHAAVLEPNSPIAINLDGFYLSRAALNTLPARSVQDIG